MSALVIGSHPLSRPALSTSYGQGMRQQSWKSEQRSEIAGQLSEANRTDLAERIVAFVCRKYPLQTAINVAADTGIAADTIQKMIERVSAPSAANYIRMMLAYGPGFLRETAGRSGWIEEAAERAERERQLARRDQLASELAQLNAEIASDEALP